MPETVYKAKMPFKQEGNYYYPITTFDQIILPDNNRWDGNFLHKNATEAEWEQATDFIPELGEIIIYNVDANNELPRMKIGDGHTLINDLPFAYEPGSLTAIDDGDGNVTITLSGGLEIQDDGNGNVVIA